MTPCVQYFNTSNVHQNKSQLHPVFAAIFISIHCKAHQISQTRLLILFLTSSLHHLFHSGVVCQFNSECELSPVDCGSLSANQYPESRWYVITFMEYKSHQQHYEEWIKTLVVPICSGGTFGPTFRLVAESTCLVEIGLGERHSNQFLVQLFLKMWTWIISWSPCAVRGLVFDGKT